MQFILTLLSDTAYVDLALSFVGWAGWVALFTLDAFLYVRFTRINYPRSEGVV